MSPSLIPIFLRYEADEEICPNAGIHSGNFLTLRASSRSGSIWHLAPPLYLKSDSILEYVVPQYSNESYVSVSLLGIGKEIIVPSSNIGLEILPLAESNPFLLNMTFILCRSFLVKNRAKMKTRKEYYKCTVFVCILAPQFPICSIILHQKAPCLAPFAVRTGGFRLWHVPKTTVKQFCFTA